MRIGIAKAIGDQETRAALTPAVAKKLCGQGIELVMESGLGLKAGSDDQAYIDAGVTLAEQPSDVWSNCDIVITLDPPNTEAIPSMREGAVLVGMLSPYQKHDVVRACESARVTAFSMELLPRISRAQSMDVLSSQANIGGYKAVLLAADHCPKVMPMMITAAGTLAPAKVFILGAGVAGLQAIATAKRLGAVVEAYDVRAATKEQVQSLGARFVELPSDGTAQDDKATGGYAKEQTEEERQKQAELMAKHVIAADIVITTAAVPGKAPPMLIAQDVVDQMKRGSVVVDMAANPDHGRGNCEATTPGEVVTNEAGVTLIGTLNLPSLVPVHASQAYASNMQSFLDEIIDVPKEGEPTLKLNLEDEVQKGSCLTHDGQIVHEQVKSVIESA